MKTKTQLLIATLLIASTLVGFSYASTWTDYLLPVEQSYDALSCANTAKLYLNQDNDHDTLGDYYLYLNSNFMYSNNTVYNYSAIQVLREFNGTVYSKVVYYTPANNMIYKINSDNGQTGTIDNSTFWRPSRVFPYNTPVRGITSAPNQIIFEQPSDNNPAKNTVGFVYTYKYITATNKVNNSTSSYRYNAVPNLAYMLNTGLIYTNLLPGVLGNQTRKWSTSLQTHTSCKNYQLNRCGDGKTDTYDSSWSNQFSGELCDDGALNGTPDHCPVGCGNGVNAYFCGDSIINDGSSSTTYISGAYTYGPTYMSGGVEQIEQCDEGSANNDNYQITECSTFCEKNLEPESFPEELG